MKFAPFVVITLAIGLAVAWLAPGAPDKAAESSAGSGQESSAELAVLQQDQWLAG